MRTLVSGSSGFVGSHLVRWLLQHGHEVTGLDKAEPRRPLPAGTEGWHDVRGDILDRTLVAELMRDADVVFHLACRGVRPSTVIAPCDRGTRSAIARSNSDLPQPDGPLRVTHSPASMVRSIGSSPRLLNWVS